MRREKNLGAKLQEGVGKRTLVMLSCFPFFMVGKMLKATPNYVIIKPDFGIPPELKGEEFCLELASISTIFYEIKKGQIPDASPLP